MRPKAIRLAMVKRENINNLLYIVYKLMRIFYVSLWFYTLPFIALIAMYTPPFLASLQQNEEVV